MIIKCSLEHLLRDIDKSIISRDDVIGLKLVDEKGNKIGEAVAVDFDKWVVYFELTNLPEFIKDPNSKTSMEIVTDKEN